MPLAADFRLLIALVRGMPRRGSHGERLRHFYASQAERYDDFRERLLAGRQQLINFLPASAGSRVVELGGGTGRNLDFFGARLKSFASVEVVDLCPPLLDIARRRFSSCANVSFVHADATTYAAHQPADCVYFSYALTMIPDWRRAIDNALAMLKPGGILGVVDFYVSSAMPEAGLARHPATTRALYRRWFAHDGVHLSPDHLPYLRSHLETAHLIESRAALPYLPWMKAPYYVFVGRKPLVTL